MIYEKLKIERNINMTNILILSCGTRNKIVQYFKKELGVQGKVYATDNSELAPALYEADEQFIVPRTDDPYYLETILNICKDKEIDGVLSLIDPELLLLSEHKEKFLEIGTTPIISSFELIKKSFNKYEFNEYLKDNGFNYMKCYIDLESFYKGYNMGDIEFPVFVKPVKGSASINISKVDSKEELETLFSRFDDLMIQEFMDGVEYGVDAYIDMISKEPVSIFIKEKILMRAGETDKSVSVKNKEILQLVENFLEETPYEGIIDIDLFEKNGEYYISEVNPRFGGGYPHGYESGVNIPNQIINNLNEKKNTIKLNNYDEDVYMMKYNEVFIRRSENIID